MWINRWEFFKYKENFVNKKQILINNYYEVILFIFPNKSFSSYGIVAIIKVTYTGSIISLSKTKIIKVIEWINKNNWECFKNNSAPKRVLDFILSKTMYTRKNRHVLQGDVKLFMEAVINFKT